ncbi:MAG: M56 family metallopeptidase, partial [Pseudohongiellaceae bacterium]
MGTSMLNMLALVMSYSPVLSLLLDMLIKSSAVLVVFGLLFFVSRRRLNDSSRHLLWFNSLLCLALLPLLPSLLTWLSPVSVMTPPLIQLTALVAPAEKLSTFNWDTWILAFYLVPATLLLLRLGIGVMRLAQLRQQADFVDAPSQLNALEDSRHRLGISRRIDLRISNQVVSPVSFGLLRPQVILPDHAQSWSAPILQDVLVHELSHIKRLDWLSMLLGYLIVSVFWFNPLAWLVLRKLNEETENCCDAAVVYDGRSNTDYAESLLSVARVCAHSHRAESGQKLLAQTMLDQTTLQSRITQILEDKIMKISELKKQRRNVAAILLLLTAGLLTVMGSTQVVSAQQREEMFPLNTVEPMYPTLAAAQSIEGWVVVEFTVTETGDVGDARVVDAEPSDIFNASALRAVSQFRFSPRS